MLCFVEGDVYDRWRCLRLVRNLSSVDSSTSIGGIDSIACSVSSSGWCSLDWSWIGVGRNASGVDDSVIVVSCGTSWVELVDGWSLSSGWGVGFLAGVAIACVMQGTLLFGVQKNLRRLPLVSWRYGAVPYCHLYSRWWCLTNNPKDRSAGESSSMWALTRMSSGSTSSKCCGYRSTWIVCLSLFVNFWREITWLEAPLSMMNRRRSVPIVASAFRVMLSFSCSG